MPDEQDHSHEHDHLTDDRWYAFLTGDYSQFTPRGRRGFELVKGLFSVIPSEPRCLDCNAPFHGLGGILLRPTPFRQSSMTPRLCNVCETVVKRRKGGAEVPMAMLFADVRGSTTLAEEIGVTAFRDLINRFYQATTEVLIRSNALIDKLIGDEVAGFFVPGFAGPDYARIAVEAAQELLRATGHEDPDGPWVPVGAGVHVGTAYLGAVGSVDRVADITALGDPVNTAARLASQAKPGEVIVSHETATMAELDTTSLEQRQLDLKGKKDALPVHVLHVRAG